MVEKYVEMMRSNNLYQIYPVSLALILMGIAIFIFAYFGKSSLTIGIGGTLILLSLTIVTYLYSFLKINPYYKGIIFTFITTGITAVIYVFYSKFFPNANSKAGIALPFFIQLLISKIILKYFS